MISDGKDDGPRDEAAPAWGSATGAISLQPVAEPAQRSASLDRLLITELASRYCWAVDERRQDLLEECFTVDAVWEGSVVGAHELTPMHGRERIVEWLTGFWPYQRDQRRHLLLNTVVERQAEDEALALSYLLLTTARGGVASLESTGFYRLAVVWSAGVWRIDHIFTGFDVPFWPGKLENLSERARIRHGLSGS